jgi:rubrerythrin
MKFGKLKSKIENKLVESYKNGTIKSDMSKFNSLVLKNKNVSKLFYLYDELTSNRGLNESIANEYINQSITFYENTINKINSKDLKDLNSWIEGTEYNNEYDVVDELFSTGITKLEEKITSKKTILETITKSPKEEKKVVNIPLKTMVGIANKTISNYVSNLNESDQKKLKTILSSNEDELKEKYNSLKENVISKLEKIQESEQDKEVGNAINETIEKVNSESFDKLNYLKLQELNNNL